MLTKFRLLHKLAVKASQLSTPKIPTDYSQYISLLSSCSDLRSLLTIHARIVILGMSHDNSILNHLINKYSSLQKCNIAMFVFNSVTNPGVILYNSAIRAYSRAGQYGDAIDLYHKMLERYIEPDKYTYTFVLKACAGNLDFNEGVRVHNDVISRHLELDVYVCTGLVDMYCKMGQLDHAREVFDKMPKTDIVSWNAIITGLSEDGHPVEALGFVRAMQLSGIVPNAVTLLNFFPCLCKLKNGRLCREVHGFVIRRDFGLKVYNGLIDTYSKCGLVADARSIFDGLHIRDHVSWGSMMAGYARNGYSYETLGLFNEVKGNNAVVNKISLVSSSLAASNLRDLQIGKEIHSCAIKYNMDSDIVVATSLMTMYIKCGELVKANKLFKGLKGKDIVAYSALIAALGQSGFPLEALSLFRDMLHEKLRPSSVTMLSIFSACAELSSVESGKCIHSYCLRAGLDSELAVANAMVSMYAKLGLFIQAFSIFLHIPCKNIVSWNSLISGYVQSGDTFQVMSLFHELLSSGLKPDFETMIIVMPACALSHGLEYGICLHALIIKSGFASDCHVKNALIDVYAKCSQLSSAESLFNENDYFKDEVSWNTMIAGYVHNRRSKEALSAFNMMKSQGLTPSVVSIVSVLPGVADLTALQEGMSLHAITVRMGFQSNTHISNSLIDMYAKCGRFDCAEKYFGEMKNKDTITWNIMLSGYGIHGHATRALELFSQMEGDNMMLDSVTFLSVLSALRHGGYVEEARGIFNSMHKKYHLTPKLEHYACLIDLLGRNGLFSEIMNLIMKMPMEPDAAVWVALLDACRMHSNLELAELSLSKLVKLEPGNPAHVIGLSNIYAQSGRWVEARNMRLKVSDDGLRKIPGCSWV